MKRSQRLVETSKVVGGLKWDLKAGQVEADLMLWSMEDVVWLPLGGEMACQ